MARHNHTFADPRQAIVIAAFAREVKTDCASSTAKAQRDKYRVDLKLCHREADQIPDSFETLKKCIMAKDCHIFDRYNHDGHGTNPSCSPKESEARSVAPTRDNDADSS